MSIKNIVFDIGNVLGKFRYDELLSDIGLTKEEQLRVTNELVLTPLWDEVDLCIKPKDEVIEDFKNAVPGLENEIGIMFDRFDEVVESYDYAKDLVDYAKDKGYKVYLLSNYADWLFDAHEKNQFNFLDRIDGKIVSGYVHLVKPDPAIYKLLLETYDLKASECIFFDDRLNNVEGARKVGMRAEVFTSYEECVKVIDSLG